MGCKVTEMSNKKQRGSFTKVHCQLGLSKMALVDFYTCLLPSDHYGGFEWPPFGWKLAILLKKDDLIWFVDVYVLRLHGPNPYLLFWNGPFSGAKTSPLLAETSGGVWFPTRCRPCWYRLVRFTDPRCSYAGTGFRNIGSPAFGMKRKPFHGGAFVPGKGGRVGRFFHLGPSSGLEDFRKTGFLLYFSI